MKYKPKFCTECGTSLLNETHEFFQDTATCAKCLEERLRKQAPLNLVIQIAILFLVIILVLLLILRFK